MKRGAAPKYKELGSSPAKVDLTKKTGSGPTERLNRELVKNDDDQRKPKLKMNKSFEKATKIEQDPKYSDLEKYDDDRG